MLHGIYIFCSACLVYVECCMLYKVYITEITRIDNSAFVHCSFRLLTQNLRRVVACVENKALKAYIFYFLLFIRNASASALLFTVLPF